MNKSIPDLVATTLAELGLPTHPSPHHLDFIDHLTHTLHADDRFLGKLLEIEARHLPPEEQAAFVALAPNPLHSQMRLRP